MKKVVFVIDDEKDIQEILETNLKATYNVHTFSSALDAQKALKVTGNPDIIILDIMMDGMDGYELCKYLKSDNEYKNIPIIFLSAKSAEFDKVLGLELGGDDYLAKPFSLKELQSRIKAVLRRTEKSNNDTNIDEPKKKIIYKTLVLSPDNYSLVINEKNVKLTKTEFRLLYLFFSHPEKIFSRDNIIDSIRGQDVYVVDRTIDVHIMNLRKKLKEYKNILITFSGVGYGLKLNENE